MATSSVAPTQNLAWDDVLELKDTGYLVFRLAKDVIINNNEVIEEQERMVRLSGVEDTWMVTTVKPECQTYIVVIGESARRDALGAFGDHWDNTPFASGVNGLTFVDYIAVSDSMQESSSLTLNRVVDNKPQFQGNFVTPVNCADSQIWWFSNQGQIGKYSTAIASIARRAGEVHLLKEGDFEVDRNTENEALLDMIAQVLVQEHP